MTRTMRRMRKYLMVVACIALVMGLAIGGTVAWLADSTEKVENTFSPSDVDITLTETTSNYHMVPGEEIDKDPLVTVTADSEKCWVFVQVTKTNNPDTYLDYSIANGWNALASVTGVYYRIVEDTASNQTFGVLTDDKVTVKSTITKSQMDALNEETKYPQLTFKAYAIQYAGFDDDTKTDAENAAAAWAQINTENFGGNGFTGNGANQ